MRRHSWQGVLLYGQKSWDTFAFLGRFPIHTGPTPPLTLQNNVGRVYPEFFSKFQLCIGWGKGELQLGIQK